LTISNGSTVDLSAIQDGTGTDAQTLSLSGNDLSISNGNTVDLSAVLAPLEQMISDLSTRVDSLVTALDACCNANPVAEVKSSSKNPVLYQNVPNPFGETTTIKYYIPDNVSNARIEIRSMTGVLLNKFNITTKGEGNLMLSGDFYATGSYVYSLIINDKLYDTKKFVLKK